MEETRVGQKTNYDRLVVEIWTDGSVHPEMALVEGAKILRKHLNPFVQSSELGRQVHAAARGGPGSAEAQLEAKLNNELWISSFQSEPTTASNPKESDW